jgi:NAD(P)-dependent dehydrogenase (short-subunit alcohol dehydrogenase family)
VGYAAAEVIGNVEGYHVIVASRNAENGQKAVEAIKASTAMKGTLSTVKLDVNDAASVKEAAKQVEEQYGRIDVLINNAGIGISFPVLKIVVASLTENSTLWSFPGRL